MGIVNGASLAASYVEYQGSFKGAFDAAMPDYEKLTGEGSTSKRSSKMFWGGSAPMMREWLGDAQFDQLDLYSWQLDVKKYQAGLEVKRDDIVDDELDWVVPYIQGLAVEARMHPGRLVYDLINNGDTALCYDGQFFFDTDHQDGTGPVQTNKITGVLNEANIQVMRQTMGRLKDHKNRPMPRRLTHILVPPELEQAANKILTTEYGTSGASNVENGKVVVLVSSFLTSAIKWYGFDLSTPFRPLQLRWREKPTFVTQDSLTDDQAFIRQVFRYNAWGRYAVGYGLWQYAAMSTGV